MNFRRPWTIYQYYLANAKRKLEFYGYLLVQLFELRAIKLCEWGKRQERWARGKTKQTKKGQTKQKIEIDLKYNGKRGNCSGFSIGTSLMKKTFWYDIEKSFDGL